MTTDSRLYRRNLLRSREIRWGIRREEDMMTIEDTEGIIGIMIEEMVIEVKEVIGEIEEIIEEDMAGEEVEEVAEVAEVGEEEVDIIRDMIRRDIEEVIGIIKKVAIMRREGKEDIRIRINHFRKFPYFLF